MAAPTEDVSTYNFNTTEPGRCTGTLNGKEVTDAPITAQVAGPGNLSCLRGESTDPGTGALTFTQGPGDDDDIVFPVTNFTFQALGPEVLFQAGTEQTGTATGRAQFLTGSDQTTLQACEEGTVTELNFEAFLDTGDSTLRSPKGAEAPPPPPPTPQQSPSADTVAPETEITSGPKRKSTKRTAKFEFEADEASTFECKLAGKRAKAKLRSLQECSSPQRYKKLRLSKYRFLVQATDEAGNTDPTPAKQKFQVKKKKK